MHDPQALWGEIEVAQGLGDRLARQVHVGLRQHQPDPVGFRVADQRLPPLAIHLNAQPASQLVNACEAEVVARVGVLRLGIAEPNDQQLFSNQLLTHPKTDETQQGPRRAPQTG